MSDRNEEQGSMRDPSAEPGSGSSAGGRSSAQGDGFDRGSGGSESGGTSRAPVGGTLGSEETREHNDRGEGGYGNSDGFSGGSVASGSEELDRMSGSTGGAGDDDEDVSGGSRSGSQS